MSQRSHSSKVHNEDGDLQAEECAPAIDTDEATHINEQPGPAHKLELMDLSDDIIESVLDHEHHAKIKHLDLFLWHMDPDILPENHGRWNSSGALKAFFFGLNPASVRLYTLELAGINLQGSHLRLLSSLDLQALRALTISRCGEPEAFLRAQKEDPRSSSMHLETLTFYHSQKQDSPESSMASSTSSNSSDVLADLDMFLNSGSLSLKRLWICLRGFEELPNIEGIKCHASTLTTLFIDVRKYEGPHPSYYSLEDWRQLCDSFQNLQQLDAPYPPVTADFHLSTNGDFNDYICTSLSIPTLHCLGVNTWASPPDFLRTSTGRTNFDYLTFDRGAYRHMLANLATSIVNLRPRQFEFTNALPEHCKEFSRSGHMNRNQGHKAKDLRFITFGIAEEILYKYTLGFRLRPMSFIKSRITILGGEQRWAMEPALTSAMIWMVNEERESYDIDKLAHEVGKHEI
ncbi:MAG: hypothetical protein Q9222_005177 [Ikaeria aurantiellina]